MGMFDLPGTAAANRAGKAMSGLANSYTSAFNQYYQPSLAALWQQANSKTLSPWQQGQFNDYQAGSLRDTQDASQQLQQNLVNRGMGQSGVASGALANLWNQYSKNMLGARQQQMNQLDQQRLQALQAMLGQAGNAGQSAMGAQQGVYQNALQQQAQYGNMLGGMGGLLGQLWGIYGGGV